MDDQLTSLVLAIRELERAGTPYEKGQVAKRHSHLLLTSTAVATLKNTLNVSKRDKKDPEFTESLEETLRFLELAIKVGIDRAVAALT